MNIEQALDLLIRHEGGYSDNPADPGGRTMYGITERVARQHGYTGDMRELPMSVAATIYRKQYWSMIKADQLPEALRFHVFDAAVNSGNVQSIKWLQECAGVKQDGIVGPMTLKAAENVTPWQYSAVRLRFMTELKNWPTFSRGWARRICDNLELIE